MRVNTVAILIAIVALSIAVPTYAGSGYIFDNFTVPMLSEDRNGNMTLDEGEDYNGNGVLDLPTEVTLFDYEGSIIIIDFFAYWCGPCLTASPKIQTELYEYYIQRLGNPNNVPVHVWGISMQGEQEGLTKADIDQKTYEFLDKVPTVSYPMMMDYERVAWDMTGSSSIPHMVVINGIPNDPNYMQWEVLFGESGYGGPDTIRGYVDSINPSFDPLLNFSTNQGTYFPGDSLSANFNLRYYGQSPSMDLYVALSAFDQIIFYPNWSSTLSASQLLMSRGYNEDFAILSRIPISTDLPEGTYSLLAICAESGTYNPISDLAQLDFNISHSEKGEMRSYFKDNPVYKDPESGRWPFTINLENTGPTDITIDMMTLEFFDTDGTSTGVQDYSANFPQWFSALGGLVATGKTVSATLNIQLGSNESGKAQFYFHGVDENSAEVETTSDVLDLLPAQ